ncbi:hypothetical protein DPMN_120164 [Dreissena polymorpha]|uniref:Uncharacterized protein n=3 Tax=Dreissena polymorpha TaxID=45954 RepID=A0A9D4GKD0_DREPO|nr:hypothetical protein DPMN_120164 [Dreissena polymorpha]
MQLMSPSNHLAVLEEIVKGGNLHRDKLPPLFDSMGPVEQVKLFMSLIPKETLQSGEDTTKKVLKQKADVIV